MVNHPSKILITGASGFIGNAACNSLAGNHHVIGTYHKNSPVGSGKFHPESVDLSDFDKISGVCKRHKPDIVIHCAAIAHQKVGAIDRDTYFHINSHATEHLARASTLSNPGVLFIFLSSISVYGENNLPLPVSESYDGSPSSDYGASKCDAERRLMRLVEKGDLRQLIVLRLAPVYDRLWHVNLDRRILFPRNLFYMKFSAGKQQMSALARPNLLDFIAYLINIDTDILSASDIFNVCDDHAYTFNDMIHVFRQASIYPVRPVIRIPLFPVFLGTRLFGILFSKQREWFHACYEKLASDLIFDNKKMLGTGFKPRHSLKSIFFDETFSDTDKQV